MSTDRRSLLAGLAGAAGLCWAGSGAIAAPARSPYAIDTLVPDGPDFDIPAALLAGLDGAFIDLVSAPRTQAGSRADLDAWADAVAKGKPLQIVRNAIDFGAAKSASKFAVVLNSQDAAILEDSGSTQAQRFAVLREFYDLGLRGLQLTYNDRSLVGDGYWEQSDVPLSLYGRALVAELNKLGVLIDLSHCGDVTTADAIQQATRPVAVTHSGARALFDHRRNKSDAVIRQLADKGGYFGVYNMTLWMTSAQTSSVATVVDHIDHVVKIGGIDLVGYGGDHAVFGETRSQAKMVSDMTGWALENASQGKRVGKPPIGQYMAMDLNGPDRLVRLAAEMSRRGYRQRDIDKVLGLNFLRVFQAACG